MSFPIKYGRKIYVHKTEFASIIVKNLCWNLDIFSFDFLIHLFFSMTGIFHRNFEPLLRQLSR